MHNHSVAGHIPTYLSVEREGYIGRWSVKDTLARLGERPEREIDSETMCACWSLLSQLPEIYGFGAQCSRQEDTETGIARAHYVSGYFRLDT